MYYCKNNMNVLGMKYVRQAGTEAAVVDWMMVLGDSEW